MKKYHPDSSEIMIDLLYYLPGNTIRALEKVYIIL
jgi:hypothetical protein